MDTKAMIRAEMERRLKGKQVDLRDDTSLLNSGVIDSGGVFELVEFVETQFKIKVADDEIVPEHFESIDSIAKLVESKG
jgi:acyl carrier protein